MKENKVFFGIRLTHKDCLGWTVGRAFEIIENHTTRAIHAQMSDWLKEKDPPFALACLFAAIADCAECLDQIEPPVDDGVCDGGPGLGPPPGKSALQEDYFQQSCAILSDIDDLMQALPEVVQFSLNSTKDSQDSHWEGEVYMWLKEFFATAKQHWPNVFCSHEKVIMEVLQLPAFAECRLSEQRLSQLPEQGRKYLEDIARELFKLKFSWRDRPDYRQTK